MNKMLMDHSGVIDSLCDSCSSADCDNPIETRKVSLIGILKNKKVFVRGDEVYFVIGCEGYIK